MNGQARSSRLCALLRACAALLARTADRLDALRLAAAGSVRPPAAGEEIVAARDRILSRSF
jgi:hypothetical protein